MKTGGKIHNITEKNAERDLLCVQPTNPDLRETTWTNTALRKGCCAGVVLVRVTLTMLGKAAITYAYALVYLYTPEVYPTVVRGAGLGVGTLMSRLGGIVAPLVADLVSSITHRLVGFL